MPDTSRSAIKPTHKAIQGYYAALQSFSSLNVSHETGLRTAFQNLLTETARTQRWTLITEQTLKVGGKIIRPDGVMRDTFNLPRGYWEAKDTNDDLDAEIKKKSAKGYYSVRKKCLGRVGWRWSAGLKQLLFIPR